MADVVGELVGTEAVPVMAPSASLPTKQRSQAECLFVAQEIGVCEMGDTGFEPVTSTV